MKVLKSFSCYLDFILLQSSPTLHLNEMTGFVENTLKNDDYKIWLKTTDIMQIAYFSYGWSIKNGNRLQVLGSLKDLKSILCKWHSYTQPISLIININNNHWVSLVICQRDKGIIAYYVDSFGTSIPANIVNILNQEIPDISIIFSNVVQQKDKFSCGIFALENIKIIKDAIDSEIEDDRIIDSVKNYIPTSEQLIEIRKKFAKDLDWKKIYVKSVKNNKNVHGKAIFGDRAVIILAVVAMIVAFTTGMVVFELITTIALLVTIYTKYKTSVPSTETNTQLNISENNIQSSFSCSISFILFYFSIIF